MSQENTTKWSDRRFAFFVAGLIAAFLLIVWAIQSAHQWNVTHG